MENLELQYSLVNNEKLSSENLKKTLGNLQAILDKNGSLEFKIDGISDVLKDINALTNSVKDLSKVFKSIDTSTLTATLKHSSNFKFNKEINEINKFKSAYNSMIDNISKNKANLSSPKLYSQDFKKQLDEVNNYTTKGSDYYRKMNSELRKLQATQNNFKIVDDKEVKKLKSLLSEIESLGDKPEAMSLRKSFDTNLKILKDELAINKEISSSKAKAVNEQIKKNEKIINAMQEQARLEERISIFKQKKSGELDSARANGKISDRTYKELSSMVKGITPETQNIDLAMQKVGVTIANTTKKAMDLKRAMAMASNAMQGKQDLKHYSEMKQKDLQRSVFDLKNGNLGSLVDHSKLDEILSKSSNLGDMKNIKQARQMYESLGVSLKSVRSEAKASQRALDLANHSAITFGDAVRNAAQKFGIWSMVTVGYYKAIQSLKYGIIVVKDLDSAMVDIKRVTNETDETYQKFERSVAGIGRAFAKTGIEVAKATTTFARMGYTLKEATEIAKESLLLANVGDMGVEDASNAMISAVKGFNIPINKIAELNDAMNELGNTMPITVEGLSQALQRSAAIMSYTGNTYQETLAMASTANGVVQNPEKIGNGLRTIGLRIAGSKDEETGEDYSEIVPKLEKDFDRLDIKIQDTEGNLKSTYDVLMELGRAFEKSEMSDLEKTNMLEAIAGKYNVNTAAAIISNYKEAEKALEIAMNSKGSAMKENEKYLESIEGKLSVLKNRWQEFWQLFFNSKHIKSAVDLASGFMGILTKIFSNNAGKLVASSFLLLGIMVALRKEGILFLSAFNGIYSLLAKAPRMGWINGMVIDIDKANKNLFLLSNKLKDLQSQQLNLHETALKSGDFLRVDKSSTAYQDGLKNPDKKLSTSTVLGKDGRPMSDLTQNQTKYNTLAGQIDNVKKSYIQATAKAIAFNLAMSIGLMAAVSIVGFAIGKIVNHNKELAQSSSDAITTFNSNIQSIQNNEKNVGRLATEYEVLYKKQNKTVDETDRFVNLSNELAGIFPSLVSYYDDAGNAVLNYSGNVEKLNEELEKQKQLERDRLISKSDDIVQSAMAEKRKVGRSISMKKDELAEQQYQKKINLLKAKELPDNSFFPDEIERIDKTISAINSEIRTSEELLKSLSSPLGSLADAILKSKESYKDLNSEQRASLETIKELYSLGFNGSASDFRVDINKIYDNLPSLTNLTSGIDAKTSEEDINKIKTQLTQSLESLDLNIDNNAINLFVEDLIANIQGKFNTKPFEFKLKVAQDEISSLIESLTEIEDAIKKTKDGYSFSYDEINKLKGKYPELEKAIYRTADGWRIEQSALELLRQTQIKQRVDFIESQRQQTINAALAVNDRLKLIESEIKGIKSLSDAYALVAKEAAKVGESSDPILGSFGSAANYEQYSANKGVDPKSISYKLNSSSMPLDSKNGLFVQEGLPKGVKTEQEFYDLKAKQKAILDLGKNLDEINNLKEEINNISKGNISGGSPDKNKDKDKYEIDSYANAIEQLNLLLNKLQATREKMVVGSKAYQDSLAKEIEIIKQKKLLAEQELVLDEKKLKNASKSANVKTTTKTISAPAQMPIQGRITSRFGEQRNGYKHEGLD